MSTDAGLIIKGLVVLQLQKRKLDKIRYLAVDEFALRKGHHYMTVVMDLETGQILHAQEGKDAQVPDPFPGKTQTEKGISLGHSYGYVSCLSPGRSSGIP